MGFRAPTPNTLNLTPHIVMSKTHTLPTTLPREKVFIVVIHFKNDRSPWGTDELLYEMQELVKACEAEVIGHAVCSLADINPKYFIGEGKLDEIMRAAGALGTETIVFSEDLKGSQQRNLEEKIDIKTIDRTQLILDIFAKRATSREGKMQVELAQLEYLLPRLVGRGIELSRQGAGIGTLGPGETKLEADRRRISDRIAKLKRALIDVEKKRALTRKRRKDKGVPVVSLVGYTNAGKSTLLNTLTDADALTRDGLFTTLDSLSRQLTLTNNQKMILSDTVGFMHALPHHLIESFKATLEELQEADVLMHVVDVSRSNFKDRMDAVHEVLEDLDVAWKKVLYVFNKIDQVEDTDWLDQLKDNYEHCAFISAKQNINLDELQTALITMLSSLYMYVELEIPMARMDLINVLHEQGKVSHITYGENTIEVEASIPVQVSNVFKPFLNK